MTRKTPDERISELTHGWTGSHQTRYSLTHEELVKLIQDVECDVLDWQSQALRELSEAMVHDRYAGDPEFTQKIQNNTIDAPRIQATPYDPMHEEGRT
jgi:hypothetical protein